MTQSLTARLQERQATQSAEIERITASELHRLGQSLRAESELALSSMRSAMAESMESTTASLLRDLGRLKRLGRWWWGTMALSWATMAGLTAFSLWLWMSPPSTTARLSGVGVDPVFTSEGRTYLLLPQGTQAMQCRQGAQQWVPCVALPVPATSPEPSLERVGATSATVTGERVSGEPSVRPPARPSGS